MAGIIAMTQRTEKWCSVVGGLSVTPGLAKTEDRRSNREEAKDFFLYSREHHKYDSIVFEQMTRYDLQDLQGGAVGPVIQSRQPLLYL